MTVKWNENLETGISIIDEQHKQLFETIEKLETFQKSKAQFNEVIMELKEYVAKHFKTEEEYMHYTIYPEFSKHRASHDKFVEDFRNILKTHSETGNIMDIGPTLAIFVEAWLNDHYKNEDVKLASYIKKCQLKD